MPLAPIGPFLRRLGIACLLAMPLAGQGAAEASSRWLVRAWKTGELPGNKVADLLQDPDGFIWMTAAQKLVQFDGAHFAQFSLADRSYEVRTFIRTRDGGLAVAFMNEALGRVRDGKLTVLSRELTTQKRRVEYLFEEDADRLWVVTNDEAVFLLHAGRLTALGPGDGLPPGLHCRFAFDERGRLWFVKGRAVGLVAGSRFETLREFPGTTLRLALAPARGGGMWVAAGAALLQFQADGIASSATSFAAGNSQVRPTAVLEDSRGAVWIGTYAHGLFRFAQGQTESVPISYQSVTSLLQDREDGIWVATSAGGLDQVVPRALALEGSEVGLASETVKAICEDAQHALWAVTQDGKVVRRIGGGWQPIAGLDLDNATSLAAGPSGAIWIGAKSGDVYRWQGGVLRTWGAADGLGPLPVRDLLVASGGDLWVASCKLGSQQPAELHRLRGDRVEPVPLAPVSTLIRGLAQDAAGDVWVAGVARRLWRFEPDGRCINEAARLALPAQQIHTMHCDDAGNLWIGFDRAGVGLVRHGRFALITHQNGLFDDRIQMLLPDREGGLWLSANEAIFRISTAELQAVADGTADQVKSIRFGQDQGVRAVFADPVGALQSSDGRIWIPMATSLAIIDPAQTRFEATPPPVYLMEVAVDGTPVAARPGLAPGTAANLAALASGLRLQPSHRRLDFAFTALSFRAPSNVLFRYRLDGFDDRWIDAGTARTASYPRLPAGRYRFQVKACNSDGVWNETGAMLAFSVAPFVWDTWWFRTAVFAFFTAAVVAFARYFSIRRLQNQLRVAERQTAVERERARIARDIHDELGARLNQIVLLSGLAARRSDGPEASEQRVWEISETARQLLGSLDETVWAVNPRNDTLTSLIDYLGEFAVGFMRTAEIRCHVDLPIDPPDRAMPADVRHQLSLAVKEALTNIVRHAQATAAWLRIEVRADSLAISIEDNGRGFAPGPERAGADGLRNLRQRMSQIGGQVEIEPRPGEGTRIRFTVPWTHPL